METDTYSPQEAAAVSGAPLAAIQKAITAHQIPAFLSEPAKRRRIDETALRAFALAQALPSELHLSPGAAYRLLHDSRTRADVAELAIGDLVRIDARRALATARQRLNLYERAKQIIVRDPAIMGGAPTIRGTRITAHSILGRIEDGDSIESILDDYPYLDRDTIGAAAIYAKRTRRAAGQAAGYGAAFPDR